MMLRPHAVDGDVRVALGKKARGTVTCLFVQLVEPDVLSDVADVLGTWWRSVANMNEHAAAWNSPGATVPIWVRQVREN